MLNLEFPWHEYLWKVAVVMLGFCAVTVWCCFLNAVVVRNCERRK